MKSISIVLAAVLALAASHSSPPCSTEDAAKVTALVSTPIPADCLAVVKADNVTNVTQLTTYLRKNKAKAALLCKPGPCLTFIDTWKAAPECGLKIDNSTINLKDIQEHFSEDCAKPTTSNSTNGTATNAKNATTAPTPKPSSASTLTLGAAAASMYLLMQN